MEYFMLIYSIRQYYLCLSLYYYHFLNLNINFLVGFKWRVNFQTFYFNILNH